MRFAILGSGSKGNCLIVEGGGVRVLIDCGYTPRETRNRLRSLDVELSTLDAVLITHGHGDHIRGARALAGALGLPTYATPKTTRFCATRSPLRNVVDVAVGEAFRIGGLRVRPTATPHDAPGSCCYVIDDGDACFAICTDLGEPTEAVAQALGDAHALVLEFNHDAQMLAKGPYTAHLKRRIGSSRGHLSNAQGASLLQATQRHGRGNLQRLLCAHLSEVNNTTMLALGAARSVIEGDDVEVAVAPQHHPTGWLRARRRGGRAHAQAIDVEVQAVAKVVSTVIHAAPVAVAATRMSAVATSMNTTAANASTARPHVRPDLPTARHVAQRVQERQMALFSSGPADETGERFAETRGTRVSANGSAPRVSKQER